MTDRRLVLVVWHDAITQDGWESISAAVAESDLRRVESVGFVIRQTEREIVLAQSIGDQELTGRITIPLAWVTGKVVELKVPK